MEHVAVGYYCRVCLLFYANEDEAKKTHCSSRTHYENLQVRRRCSPAPCGTCPARLPTALLFQKHLEKETSKSEKKGAATP